MLSTDFTWPSMVSFNPASCLNNENQNYGNGNSNPKFRKVFPTAK